MLDRQSTSLYFSATYEPILVDNVQTHSMWDLNATSESRAPSVQMKTQCRPTHGFHVILPFCFPLLWFIFFSSCTASKSNSFKPFAPFLETGTPLHHLLAPNWCDCSCCDCTCRGITSCTFRVVKHLADLLSDCRQMV